VLLKIYYESPTYYTMGVDYFYSKKYHAQGLSVQKISDLNPYRLCGISGYAYDYEGFKPRTLEQGAQNYEALMSKLSIGRCDITIDSYVTLAGLKTIGQNYLTDPNIAWASIPGIPVDDYHMMVSKKFKHGKSLATLIEKGLKKLKSSGELDRLLKKYLE